MPITVTYRVYRGLQSATKFTDRVRAVVLDRGELEFLGLELVSDTTTELDLSPSTVGVPAVTRTLVLRPTADRAQEYPDGESQKAAVRGLYAGVLEAEIPSLVQADEPVFT
jgi:hypothetical protein